MERREDVFDIARRRLQVSTSLCKVMRNPILLKAAETKQMDTARMKAPVVISTGDKRHGLEGSAECRTWEEAREPSKTDVVGELAWPPTDALAERTDEESKLCDPHNDRSQLAHLDRSATPRMPRWCGRMGLVETPAAFAISRTRRRRNGRGVRLPFSQTFTVLKETPSSCANCSCVRPRRSRSWRTSAAKSVGSMVCKAPLASGAIVYAIPAAVKRLCLAKMLRERSALPLIGGASS
jgi:hypothetical protein